MKTSDFEVSFIKALKNHVETRHAGLRVSIPSPGALRTATPDVVVENIQTGQLLLLEVKGGSPSNTVPFASLSKLKALSNIRPLTKIVLVSSAEVPRSMKEILNHANIGVTQAPTVEDAIRGLDSELERLEH